MSCVTFVRAFCLISFFSRLVPQRLNEVLAKQSFLGSKTRSRFPRGLRNHNTPTREKAACGISTSHGGIDDHGPVECTRSSLLKPAHPRIPGSTRSLFCDSFVHANSSLLRFSQLLRLPLCARSRRTAGDAAQPTVDSQQESFPNGAHCA